MSYYDDDEALVCPHCHTEQYTHEPDEISAICCHVTCEHCEKNFWYSVDVTRSYSEYIDED